MSEFRMPSLGADMEYGTVVEWRVKPGDRVERGDIVAVVDTRKPRSRWRSSRAEWSRSCSWPRGCGYRSGRSSRA
jgi:acetyl/propionyl-CoA carboxylase alpha subunit